MHELLIGGQKSGKSAQAERLAQRWLADDSTNQVVFIVTAQGFDDEMQARIARHQSDRALRFEKNLERTFTIEEPLNIALRIQAHSNAKTLIVLDCITVWLVNYLMPFAPLSNLTTPYETAQTGLLQALKRAHGPIVVVSNEIGLGVIPTGQAVRAYVDALGLLNQTLAQACQRVTLMSAGLPLSLKGAP